MATQLGFDLPVRAALGRDDFMVAPSNAVALAMIDDWRNWAQAKLVLTGPAGAGKTHLAHVWAEGVGATIVDANALPDDLPALASGPVAVEDVPTIAPSGDAQTALFHLHNLMQAAGQPLLLTGRNTPNLWSMTLPDLQSRIDATGHAVLQSPDDTLLASVLAKLFADRQLRPHRDVIPYLITRMDRSYSAALGLVDALDRANLTLKRPITRAFASAILDNSPDFDG